MLTILTMKKIFFYLLPFCSLATNAFATDSSNKPKWKLKAIEEIDAVYIIHNGKLLTKFPTSELKFSTLAKGTGQLVYEVFNVPLTDDSRAYFKDENQTSWKELDWNKSLEDNVDDVQIKGPGYLYIKTESTASDWLPPENDYIVPDKPITPDKPTTPSDTEAEVGQKVLPLALSVTFGILVGCFGTLGVQQVLEKNRRQTKK